MVNTLSTIRNPNFTYYNPQQGFGPGVHDFVNTLGMGAGNAYRWTQPRGVNAYAGLRQGLNVPMAKLPVGANIASKAFRYGKLGGAALPWLPVAGNVLEGDLGGVGASLAGGAIGTLIGGPGLGTAIGATLGEPVIKGGINLAGRFVGINPNNPLSGPDWSLGPLALTPYARTKKQTKKAVELAKLQMPLYDEIADKDLRRQQSLQALADAGALIRGVYANNPY